MNPINGRVSQQELGRDQAIGTIKATEPTTVFKLTIFLCLGKLRQVQSKATVQEAGVAQKEKKCANTAFQQENDQKKVSLEFFHAF